MQADALQKTETGNVSPSLQLLRFKGKLRIEDAVLGKVGNLYHEGCGASYSLLWIKATPLKK